LAHSNDTIKGNAELSAQQAKVIGLRKVVSDSVYEVVSQ
jgi:hypothetical protein